MEESIDFTKALLFIILLLQNYYSVSQLKIRKIISKLILQNLCTNTHILWSSESSMELHPDVIVLPFDMVLDLYSLICETAD